MKKRLRQEKKWTKRYLKNKRREYVYLCGFHLWATWQAYSAPGNINLINLGKIADKYKF